MAQCQPVTITHYHGQVSRSSLSRVVRRMWHSFTHSKHDNVSEHEVVAHDTALRRNAPHHVTRVSMYEKMWTYCISWSISLSHYCPSYLKLWKCLKRMRALIVKVSIMLIWRAKLRNEVKGVTYFRCQPHQKAKALLALALTHNSSASHQRMRFSSTAKRVKLIWT